MPIFRILNLGNEVPNLVFEFQNALVFLGLSTSRKTSENYRGGLLPLSRPWKKS